VKDGAMNYDFDEEITAGTVISHGGAVVQAATKKLLEPAAQPAASPAPGAPPPGPAAPSSGGTGA